MKLIVNADDFGNGSTRDNAVLMLYRLGIVTSATIMAAGESFEYAVSVSGDNPDLGIGVHLCLTGPYNIGSDYKTIIDKNTGHFFESPVLTRKIRSFSVDTSEIYREYCLQIMKVMDHGIMISHLDHHHHMHFHLPVLNAMLRAARKFGIRRIRSQQVLLYENQNKFGYLYRKVHQRYLKSRIICPDGYYAPCIRDNLNFDAHLEKLSKLLLTRNKTIEIMLHPLSADCPETLFFSDSKVQSLLKAHELINYHNI